jgi:CTP synthase (UTP-ammonia lyase)
LYSNVPGERIFLAPNVNNIYKLPYIYASKGIHKQVLKLLKITKNKENLESITKIYNTLSNLKETITINLIIKYGYTDAYISLSEALKIADSYDLDLVMINDKGDPPVCKIIDYGKYKYEQKKRQ